MHFRHVWLRSSNVMSIQNLQVITPARSVVMQTTDDVQKFYTCAPALSKILSGNIYKDDRNLNRHDVILQHSVVEKWIN